MKPVISTCPNLFHENIRMLSSLVFVKQFRFNRRSGAFVIAGSCFITKINVGIFPSIRRCFTTLIFDEHSCNLSSFFIFDFLSSLPFARNASMRGVVKIDPKIFKNCRDLSTTHIFLSPTVSKRACSKFDQQSNTETVQYNFFQYLSSFSDA